MAVKINKKTFNKLYTGFSYIVRAWIVILFGIHAVMAFTLNEQMLSYFEFLGITGTIAKSLLIMVGLIDLAVLILALVKPTKYLAIWTIVWPIIPTVMDFLVNPTSYVHLVEHIISHSLPGVVYYLSVHPNFKTLLGKYLLKRT